MTNITDEVRNFLNKNPAIVSCIGSKIINSRALAFYILKELHLDASLHAIMSAIRRYEKPSKKDEGKQSLLKNIFADSKISTKSHLVLVQVKRNFKVLKVIIPEVMDSINTNAGEVLRIVEGRESIKFIFDHSKKEDIIRFIPRAEIDEVIDDLGEINIHLSEKFGDMPGMISPVLNELAIHNVNITEVIGCMPELIIIVKENDISQCHDTLLKFLYGSKK